MQIRTRNVDIRSIDTFIWPRTIGIDANERVECVDGMLGRISC